MLVAKGVGSRFRHDAGWHYGPFRGRNRLPTPFWQRPPEAIPVLGQSPSPTRKRGRRTCGCSANRTRSIVAAASSRRVPSKSSRPRQADSLASASGSWAGGKGCSPRKGSGVDFAMMQVGTTGRSAGEIDSRPPFGNARRKLSRFSDSLLARRERGPDVWLLANRTRSIVAAASSRRVPSKSSRQASGLPR